MNVARPAEYTDMQAPGPGAPEKRELRLRRLREVRAWAPVFGQDGVLDLSPYDMVVVDGIGHRATRRSCARDSWGAPEALVLSYMSLGTIEEWRPYAHEVPRSWTLGEVEDWPGERYVSPCEDWRRIVERVARSLDDLGFDGLYLDNLDIVEDFPSTRDGVIEMVKRLRDAVPEMLLIGQNGLAVANDLPIDAIAHEDTFWRFDSGYRESAAEETAAIIAGLERMRARNLAVFTLDYTPPGHQAADDVVDKARALGFVPAVSVLELDQPPHAPRFSVDSSVTTALA